MKQISYVLEPRTLHIGCLASDLEIRVRLRNSVHLSTLITEELEICKGDGVEAREIARFVILH